MHIKSTVFTSNYPNRIPHTTNNNLIHFLACTSAAKTFHFRLTNISIYTKLFKRSILRCQKTPIRLPSCLLSSLEAVNVGAATAGHISISVPISLGISIPKSKPKTHGKACHRRQTTKTNWLK